MSYITSLKQVDYKIVIHSICPKKAALAAAAGAPGEHKIILHHDEYAL
jgi:hypothetical protein